MVILKVRTGPEQPFRVAMVLIVAVWGVVTLAAAKLIGPLPVAPKPMAVLLFNQLKDAPVGVLFRPILMVAPAQACTLLIGLTAGAGVTVSTKFCGTPEHTPTVGITVILAVVTAPAAVAAVPIKLPVPLAAKPIAVLLLVQLTVALAGEGENVKLMGSPSHKLTGDGAGKVGIGVTVIKNVSFLPLHEALVGVTMIVPVVRAVTSVVVKLMFPIPVAPRPIAVLLLVQLKVVLGEPPMLMPAIWFPQ